MTLAATQQRFCDFLRDVPEVPAAQVGTRALDGLAIYHHAYRAQLRAALCDLCERTWCYLGDDAFYAAAAAHIARCPPHSWTLDAYGDGFVDTLRTLYPHAPEVAELAWIEWALRRAFSGPDATRLPAEAIATVDWDEAVLELHPNLFTSPISTNAAALWAGLVDGGTPPPAEPLENPAAILVWREALIPKFRTIGCDELAMLDGLRAGTPFGTVCETILADRDEDEAVTLVGAMLARWLQDGLIVSALAA
ncbi:MAG: putative DNA-binding domain-containing protein [Sphingomonas sp.]